MIVRDHRRVDAKLKVMRDEISRVSHEIDSLDSSSSEWFDLVNHRKAVMRQVLLLECERRDLLPNRLRDFEESVSRLRLQKRAEPRAEFVNRGEITFQNLHRSVQAISAFTGIPVDELTNMFKSNGGDLTSTVRDFWSSCSMRSDKPIVSLDLEVAAPLVYNQVDLGDYSSIIELGYVKLDCDGTVSYGGFFCGIEHELELTIGTGALDIHGIEAHMISGLKPLGVDGERQGEILDLLRDSVMVAHNADYELSQLSRSVRGFSDLVESGSVEVLDTRVVAKYLIGNLKDNTNESFVEYSGGDYVGAHRAFDDAHMTLNALLTTKGMERV